MEQRGEYQPGEYADFSHASDSMDANASFGNMEDKSKGYEDPDTCRICRGEGSEEEQLFYPCKCSGSIKYVHQGCLVEWLSHSQKKYCELCKTPFRFTKLYDPNMPQELPAPLFVKQLSLHSLRTVLTWTRLVLVAFVWLGWLPWFMRAIWRGMFWLADGNWSDYEISRRQAALSRVNHFVSNATSSMGSMGSVMSDGASAVSTASSSAAASSSSLQSNASPTSSLSASSEPIMITLVKNALSALLVPAGPPTVGFIGSDSPNMTTSFSKSRHPSWLSDIKLLNSLTSSPTINNILIDTLEGQLITLLVVISFILIFLIREWVVQQQPLANIADGEREAAVQLIANDRPRQEPEAHQPEPQPPQEPPQEPEQEVNQGQSLAGTTNERGRESSGEEEEDEEDVHAAEFGIHESMQPPSSSYSGSVHLRDLTSEDFSSPISQGIALGGAVDNSHLLGQQSSSHVNSASLNVDAFTDVCIRGNGNPEEVLRIIREEGRESELDWVVSAISRTPEVGAQILRSYQEPMPEYPESEEVTGITGREELDESLRSSAQDGQPEAGSRNGADTFASQMSNEAFTGSPYDGRQDDVPDSENDRAPLLSGVGENRGDERDATTNERPSTSQNSHRAMQAESPAPPPKSWTQSVIDWFWADVSPTAQGQEHHNRDDEQIVEDLALEAPFVPRRNNRRFAGAGAGEEPDVDEAMADAGIDANDIEAIEDGDDLEGIMELIGMQGPIFGLLQNAVFSALLIAFAVAIGIWLPYLWGKIAVVLLANPVQFFLGVPMAAVSVLADIALDTLIGSVGYVIYATSLITRILLSPLGAFSPLSHWIPLNRSVTNASLSLIDASSRRLGKIGSAVFVFHESDIPMFSVISHQALKLHEAFILSLFRAVFSATRFAFHDLLLHIVSWWSQGAGFSLSRDSFNLDDVFSKLKLFYDLGSSYLLTAFRSGLFGLGAAKSASGEIRVDYGLAVWDTKDRFIAIVMGYALASAIGISYLRIIDLLPGVDRGQRVEGLVAEILRQAGGVMKVILIIGIEMFLFPLYCGSLLDLALLPLFDGATVSSRIEFTALAPGTSLFVHWFIGTCYMFHFALFVSMCRKIMRSGVLCKSSFS